MNIVLIGYRCSGKTSVGKIIADRTGMDFYDTDELIEKSTGRSIKEIVEKDGWDRFREIEQDVIRDASGLRGAVLATGGGVVMFEENMANLKKNGYVIWLEGNVEILMKRMTLDREADNRPSLTGFDPVAEIRKVMEIRDPLYRKVSDMVINTDSLSLNEVADRIIEAVNSQPSAFS
jgi:shikimate kinase